MSAPDGCPYCRCKDVRPLSDPSLELVGYRCHECACTFYVGAEPRQRAKVTDIKDREEQRKPQKAS